MSCNCTPSNACLSLHVSWGKVIRILSDRSYLLHVHKRSRFVSLYSRSLHANHFKVPQMYVYFFTALLTFSFDGGPFDIHLVII